jgi:hypothetical protein
LCRAQPRFGQSATQIVLLGLLSFAPTCAYAVSPDATEDSDSDPGQSAYAAGRFTDALRIWRPRAEQGDARAAFGLGLLYDIGEGVGQDAAAARSWYRRAAEAGHVLAEFNLGVMSDSGTGAARDPTEAALWYARAAAHGYARAEYDLAQLYQTGEGVPRNLDMAARWYALAAGHGLPAAALKLASLREGKRRATISPETTSSTLAPAVPSQPPVASSAAGTGESVQIELSWAAPAQPVPVDFYVQVLALDTSGANRVFTCFSKQSAVLVSLPRVPADYAWRIYTVAASVPDYAPSAWSYFSTR